MTKTYWKINNRGTKKVPKKHDNKAMKKRVMKKPKTQQKCPKKKVPKKATLACLEQHLLLIGLKNTAKPMFSFEKSYVCLCYVLFNSVFFARTNFGSVRTVKVGAVQDGFSCVCKLTNIARIQLADKVTI